MDRHFPTPPPVAPEVIESLVSYARAAAAYLTEEKLEAASYGHDTASTTEALDGWAFVALALAESYDRLDLL